MSQDPESIPPGTSPIGELRWLRYQIISLCEAAEDGADYRIERATTDHERGFYRGASSEAKRIRRAIAEAVRCRIEEIEASLSSAAADLPVGLTGLPDDTRPFYACVFNDDGGVTIRTGRLTTHCLEELEVIFRRFLSVRVRRRGDTAESCVACDGQLMAGERVLDDAEGGLIHAACCGPERESYTKGDGEPLGPSDPIPQGHIYQPDQPDGQSTGQGAGEDLSAVRQAFARALPHSVKRFGEISERFKPAPDSPLTGPVGSEWAKVLAAQFETLLMGHADVWGGSIGRASITSLASELAALAARPAAPEAQGAWSFDMEAAPRDETPVPVSIRSPLDGKAAAGEAAFSIDHQQWRWTDEGYRDPIQPYAWFRLPEPPAPPASSGQGGR